MLEVSFFMERDFGLTTTKYSAMSKLPLKHSSSKIEFKAPKLDWTDQFDRELMAKNSSELIDELILEIHSKELNNHKKYKLSVQELALLFRFPIHVATNRFVEKLLRVAFQKDLNITQAYPMTERNPIYYENTTQAVQSYYYDFELNYNLLNKISFILNGSKGLDEKEATEFPKPYDSILFDKSSGIKKIVKETLKTLIEVYVRVTKPEKVGEYSNWMREILPIWNMLWFDFETNKYQINKDVRDGIKECSKKVFNKYIKIILNNTIGQKQQNDLSELFTTFVDNILPLSIVEGLSERFDHYKRITKDWGIKQVHSFTGYYYNENFKIFAILARRKNALLIGFEHGLANLIPSHLQTDNELAFLDIYIARGKNDCNWLRGNREFNNLKIISMGTPYLFNIRKWRKQTIDPEKLTLLYPSGPLRDFMSYLQEQTPERNYQHRLNVLRLIKELWKYYPLLKVFYKPFPGTYTNDPIKDIFSVEFKEDKISLFDDRPMNFYPKVDIVLWDFISTGFSESIQSGVPTLVFLQKYDYNQSSQVGKVLNKELIKCGMLFCDVESGLKSFNNVINNLPVFLKSRYEPVKKFQEATAYPISKWEFRRRFREIVLEKE